MKKLTAGVSALFSVVCLGSFTPAQAGAMYLTCTLGEVRMLIYGESKIIDGKVKSVPIVGATWGPFKPTEGGVTTDLQFTLNEADQTGSLFDVNKGTSQKLPLVTFQPETILIKKAGVNFKSLPSSLGSNFDTYTISRVDGSAIWERDMIPGEIKIQYRGQCTKSQPKKTLF